MIRGTRDSRDEKNMELDWFTKGSRWGKKESVAGAEVIVGEGAKE